MLFVRVATVRRARPPARRRALRTAMYFSTRRRSKRWPLLVLITASSGAAPDIAQNIARRLLEGRGARVGGALSVTLRPLAAARPRPTPTPVAVDRSKPKPPSPAAPSIISILI